MVLRVMFLFVMVLVMHFLGVVSMAIPQMVHEILGFTHVLAITMSLGLLNGIVVGGLSSSAKVALLLYFNIALGWVAFIVGYGDLSMVFMLALVLAALIVGSILTALLYGNYQKQIELIRRGSTLAPLPGDE